ncbi:hypothetical protein DSCW_45350 [Desulfosarcina widdelii]|uniref:Uncharacterized protein n=1 Tax=Desulfosarcina widdelii TaxID=947919 RepID=A0A5K7Z7V1_9BACT|nr:hypothetical protein [Desulfosarcina widdelii]BBO77118.1 hypothetical protein DSCW_45350 [Desulfosarcina widdelii]
MEQGALEQNGGSKASTAMAPGKSLANKKSVFKKHCRVKRAAARLARLFTKIQTIFDALKFMF